MKKYAVVVAGGAGTRMGSRLPKQFLLLQGKPVLWYTVSAFLAAYDDLVVVLVLPAEYMESGRELAEAMRASSRIRLVAGGATRWHSVREGLGLTEEDALIAVHDGVRCLVSTDLIRRCFEQASRVGSAIPVVHCADSVRLVEEEGSKPIDRSRIKLVQTPQTFQGSILLRAYREAGRVVVGGETGEAGRKDAEREIGEAGGAGGESDPGFTDDATVVEAGGVGVHLVEGEPFNIKITTPLDLAIAGRVLETRAGG